MSRALQAISEAVVSGDIDNIIRLTEEALAMKLTPKGIIDDALMPGMDRVGAQFRSGEMFIPEVLLAARTMQSAMDYLRPHLVGSSLASQGLVVIGTVEGDLHDIGKNLVKMMLEAAGFRVVDLGTDVKPDQFIEAIKSNRPQILGLSALLTTTMRNMAVVIETLKEAGIRSSVKVMVGGAPVTSDFAKSIGADAYSPNAVVAVETAKALVRGLAG